MTIYVSDLVPARVKMFQFKQDETGELGKPVPMFQLYGSEGWITLSEYNRMVMKARVAVNKAKREGKSSIPLLFRGCPIIWEGAGIYVFLKPAGWEDAHWVRVHEMSQMEGYMAGGMTTLYIMVEDCYKDEETQI